ncbi:MAG: D-alanine-D-alanine ligase [Candidatus Marinamargulisbacteria bacterium]|jgi:D-alanine-D-alanine ligase
MNELKTKRIGVLLGGFSKEREVSLRSGQNVFEALVRLGCQVIKIDPAVENIVDFEIDLAVNMLHGSFGEDGTVQAYLDFLGIPYTGSGARASLLSMNKHLTKKIMIQENLPTAPFQRFSRYLQNWTEVPEWCGPDEKMVLKPIDQGSSIGVVLVEHPRQLGEALASLLDEYEYCLAEAFVSGKEVTVGILENEDGPYALPILELRSRNQFYDYQAKYTSGMTEFVLPATLSETETELCQSLAVKLHTVIGCKGLSRVDMIVDPVAGPKILEINTVPGMTELSDLPAQAKSAGMSFDLLVEQIVVGVLREKSADVGIKTYEIS